VIGTTRDELQLYKYGAPAPELPDEAIGGILAGSLPATFAGDAPRLLEAYREARAGRGESLAGIDLVYAFQTDLMMRGPAIRLAEDHCARQPATFMYLFDQTSPVQDGALGACHALDVPFVFGNLDAPGVERLVGEGEGPARVAGAMMDAWIAFAREGAPVAAGLGAWPAYEAGRRATMMLGPHPGAVDAPREAERLALADAVAATTP
jgi:para-nitrobenzyl esterase